MTTSMLTAAGRWREAAAVRWLNISFFLILAIAALLRFVGLSQGVPYALGIDEPEIMERAVRMMKTGDFNPHFFDYPSGAIYLHVIVAIPRFLFGALGGQWGSLAEAPADAFYLWGRALTALLGTATVWLIYRAGLYWGRRQALLAAGILAVMPMHVRESHFVLTDVPLTFAVTATLLLSLRASRVGTMSAFAWAGAAAGLASSTKYSGALAVLLPLIACSMTWPLPRPRTQVLTFVLASFLIAFFLLAPYTIFDLPAFLEGFARLAAVYHGTTGPPPAITYGKHLQINLGSLLLLIAIAGLVLAFVRLRRSQERVRWALLALFPIVFYAFISKQSLVYGRYLLPAVPFLCLSASCAIVAGASRLRRAHMISPMIRTTMTAVVVIAALVRPTYLALHFDRDMAKTWTTQLAYDWVRQHVPPGSRIVIETRVLLLPPEFPAEYVKNLRLRSYDEYLSAGTQYLVASSGVYGRVLNAPEQFPGEHAEYVALFNRAPEIARFVPSGSNPGPELRILRVQP